MTNTAKLECPRCGLFNGHRYPCIDDATPIVQPVLSEGATYKMEIISAERVVKATLLKIVDDAALGPGVFISDWQAPAVRL